MEGSEDSPEDHKEKRIKFNDVVEVKKDERRKKHRTHPRRRRSAGRYTGNEQSRRNQNCYSIDHVATAPTNTTQFIINDHNSPLPRGINGSPISACPTPTNSDGGSRSRDGHEYDQIGDYYSSSRIPDASIEEQFAQEYSQFQYEKLSEMNREELIQKCIDLEEALDCYERVGHQYQHDGSSSESDFNTRPFTRRHCCTCTCNIDDLVNCNSEYSSNESLHSGTEEPSSTGCTLSSRGTGAADTTVTAADTTTKDVSPAPKSISNISPHSSGSSPTGGSARGFTENMDSLSS